MHETGLYLQSGSASVEKAFQTEERVNANVWGRSFSDLFKRQKGHWCGRNWGAGPDRKCLRGKEYISDGAETGPLSPCADQLLLPLRWTIICALSRGWIWSDMLHDLLDNWQLLVTIDWTGQGQKLGDQLGVLCNKPEVSWLGRKLDLMKNNWILSIFEDRSWWDRLVCWMWGYKHIVRNDVMLCCTSWRFSVEASVFRRIWISEILPDCFLFGVYIIILLEELQLSINTLTSSRWMFNTKSKTEFCKNLEHRIQS